MKTGTWLFLFCVSLGITVVLSGFYSGMSDRDPWKSPVFSILLISGILWLVAGLALVWRSIPDGKAVQNERQAGSPPHQDPHDTFRITTGHWAVGLIVCLAACPLLLFIHQDQFIGYCIFNGGIALLGIVASCSRPAVS